MYKQELKSLRVKKNLLGEARVTPPLGTVYAGNPPALTSNPSSRRPETSHLFYPALVCREGDPAIGFGRGDAVACKFPEGVGFRIADQAPTCTTGRVFDCQVAGRGFGGLE
jgi:hypothetical protein